MAHPRLLARATCRSICLPPGSPQPSSSSIIFPAAAYTAALLTISHSQQQLNFRRHTHTHTPPRGSIRPAAMSAGLIMINILPSTPHVYSRIPPHRFSSSSSATSDPNSPTPPLPSSSHLADAISTSPRLQQQHPSTPLKITNPRKDDDGNDMIINITPRAVDRLHHLMQSEPTTALRITVESGGCHGFQYFLSLTNIDSNSGVEEEDTIFDQDGARVIIDESSLQLLKGSKVDYTMELIGRQFKVVDGPGVKSSCGCGTSFDIKI